MGFGAVPQSKKDRVGDWLQKVETEDLVQCGMIPEFIGRLPIIGTLNGLSEADLVQVLTKPKNALLKQYQKLFEMEDINLKFTEGAYKAIAKLALKKKTGARALRSILEGIILDTMYDLPSMNNVVECIVDEETVEKGTEPKLVKSKVKRPA